MKREKRKLENPEQLEAVTGGVPRKKGGRHLTSSVPCNPGMSHDLVKTGQHKEVPVLFGLFGWSSGRDEYVCTHCGFRCWLDD